MDTLSAAQVDQKLVMDITRTLAFSRWCMYAVLLGNPCGYVYILLITSTFRQAGGRAFEVGCSFFLGGGEADKNTAVCTSGMICNKPDRE